MAIWSAVRILFALRMVRYFRASLGWAMIVRKPLTLRILWLCAQCIARKTGLCPLFARYASYLYGIAQYFAHRDLAEFDLSLMC